MLVNKYFCCRRLIVLGLLIPLLLLLVDAPTFARGDDQVIQLNNIDWRLEGDFFIVTYDLTGKTDLEYEVELFIIKDNDPSFNIVPITISGDVGKGNFGGAGRQIIWNYKKDFPEGIEGEGLRFEIHAEQISGGFPWTWIGVGAAAGGAVFLLTKKETGDGTPGITVFPLPPGRPY